MSDAYIIFKKELKNFFKDRRTLFSTFLLPLLVLPIIFVGMGSVLQSIEADARSATYPISIEGNIDQGFLEQLDTHLQYRNVDANEADIVIRFPENYVPGIRSQVVVAYDSSSQKTQFAYQQVISALSAYQENLAAKLLGNHGLLLSDLRTFIVTSVDIASEAVQSGGSILAMLVPYFLMIFLFSGSISAGLDTTCGEKERGSLAILLVNQVPRTSIAWGKILFVSVVAICSAAATFIGLVISILIPSGSDLFFPADMRGASLAVSSLAVIIAVLLSVALFTGAVVALLGSLAKSVKEGSTYVMPLYMIVVLVGVTTMYMDPTTNVLLFLIPIVNTIFVMKESFMGMIQPLHISLTVISNIGFAGLCAYMVARLFKSEKILQTV